MFTLTIEPLAAGRRKNTDIGGIFIGNMEHKVALYADDVMLFVSHMRKTIPAILNLIRDCSTISGDTVNNIKPFILLLNEKDAVNPDPQVISFKIVDHCKYLI